MPKWEEQVRPILEQYAQDVGGIWGYDTGLQEALDKLWALHLQIVMAGHGTDR